MWKVEVYETRIILLKKKKKLIWKCNVKTGKEKLKLIINEIKMTLTGLTRNTSQL